MACRRPRARGKPSAALQHIQPVLAASPAGLPPPKPQELIDFVAKFSWHDTVFRLSVLASVLANQGGPNGKLARELTVDLFLRSDPAKMSKRGRVFWAYLSRLERISPIASEAAIYFLQALAILYGTDDGPAPTDGQVAEMLVTANEYAFDWVRDDDDTLTRRERTVADTTRALGFNRSGDPARHIVRSYQMLLHRPERRAFWKNDEEWLAFQASAFSMPLDEYLETLVLPIVTISQKWGLDEAAGFELPILDPSTWWSNTLVEDSLGEAFLRGLSMSRAKAKTALEKQRRDDGLVVGPTLFYRSPFVELPDGRLVAVSPPMVREHLRGGLWGRHRNAMKHSSEWPPTFGELFEDWCQRVARLAQERSVDQIIVPETRGTEDEVEDVLIRKNDKIVFVSVKASTIPEAKMRGARSQREVLAWFDDFLFSTKGTRADGQGHGGGAIRKLDAKITKLRAGGYEDSGLPRNLKVFPLVVAYEGCLDSPAIYAWCEDRCREERLLGQRRVASVTFAAVEDFEALLALGTNGHSAIDILREKTGGRWKWGRFDVLLDLRKKGDLELRLPELTKDFQGIFARSVKRVFGREHRPNGAGGGSPVIIGAEGRGRKPAAANEDVDWLAAHGTSDPPPSEMT